MIIYERPNRFLNLGGATLGRDCIVTVACKQVLHNTVKFRVQGMNHALPCSSFSEEIEGILKFRVNQAVPQ